MGRGRFGLLPPGLLTSFLSFHVLLAKSLEWDVIGSPDSFILQPPTSSTTARHGVRFAQTDHATGQRSA